MPEAIPNNVFEYSSTDYVTESTALPKNNERFVKSKFDTCLCDAWEEIKKGGVFWYNLDEEVKRKPIPGKHNMIAQLNVKRFTQKRKPEEATQVVMPFNADKFHFGKIKISEGLFDLKRKGEEEAKDRIIINVSPIEYGHVLIVPRYQDCLPQVLDAYSIQVAVEICLLSSDRGFGIGYNSLCALASVNHLHLHAMYINSCMPIVHAKTKYLHGDIFTLDQYMVNGYALQLRDVANIIQFSRDVCQITSYLSSNNIAHNVGIYRMESFESSDDNSGHTYATIFIFPKRPATGIGDDPFHCAFLEISGFLPIGDAQEYEEMTELSALETLNKYTYTSEEFEQLSKDLLTALG